MAEMNETLQSGAVEKVPTVEWPSPSEQGAAVGAGASQSRPCHALERLFVDLNIRFAVGLAFAAPVSVESAQRALAAGLRVTGLDRLAVACERRTKAIVLASHSTTQVESVPIIDNSLTVTLEELVARSGVPSLGMVRCYLLTNPGSSANDGELSDVVGMVINANHALCDGRLLQTCIGAVADAIGGKDPRRHPPPLTRLFSEVCTTS